MIRPTVGRVVWYRAEDREDARLAAHVAYVHSDTCVNLMVIDQNGIPFNKTSVTLVQDGQVPAPGQCEWMPYQKGQAAKTEQLEREIHGGGPA